MNQGNSNADFESQIDQMQIKFAKSSEALVICFLLKIEQTLE